MRGKAKAAVLFAVYMLAAAAAVFFAVKSDPRLFRSCRISLCGEGEIAVEYGAEFSDPGCVAEYGNFITGFSKIDYTSSGAPDTKKLGDYKIIYKAENEGSTAQVERTVSVVDTTPPIITAPESVTAYRILVENSKSDNKFSVKYSAADACDGDLTDKVEKSETNSAVTLTVSDRSGNKATKKVEVKLIEDTTPPTVTLSGFSEMFVRTGTKFEDPGASAKDNCDGNISSSIKTEGAVNTAAVGSYTVTYTVTDRSGNVGKATRRVTVYDSVQAAGGTNPSGPVIYLTFDDGPGKYTEQLLSTLAKYGVKATFFVTNQFPKYQYLIGKEAQQGHAVGVHTLTHRWEIYKSRDAYFNDFSQMNAIVAKQTGQPAKIFRFPGGTSNLVSKKQCAGIMTLLAAEMPKAGYVEFDWNVSSGDTSYTRPEQVANAVTRSLRKDRPNVVLMHDIKAHSVNAVGSIINYAIKNGYTFATLNENSPACRFAPAN